MIKRVLTFVSGVQESALVYQNFALSQNLLKLSLSKISFQKRTNLYIYIFFFDFKLLK